MIYTADTTLKRDMEKANVTSQMAHVVKTMNFRTQACSQMRFGTNYFLVQHLAWSTAKEKETQVAELLFCLAISVFKII